MRSLSESRPSSSGSGASQVRMSVSQPGAARDMSGAPMAGITATGGPDAGSRTNHGRAGLKVEWEGPDTDGRALLQPDPAFEAPENGSFDLSLGLGGASDAASVSLSGLPPGTVVASGDTSAMVDDTGAIDLDGWDTHEQQGSTGGWMAQLMRDLSRALSAFHRDMWASDRSDVALTCMTEFGRNVFENGSAGTDHGHGSLMLALGGSVDGGRVLTQWPGLKNEQLYDEQDLAITIDYRDVVTEILTKRAGNTDPGTLFPDKAYTPEEWGVIS